MSCQSDPVNDLDLLLHQFYKDVSAMEPQPSLLLKGYLASFLLKAHRIHHNIAQQRRGYLDEINRLGRLQK